MASVTVSPSFTSPPTVPVIVMLPLASSPLTMLSAVTGSIVIDATGGVMSIEPVSLALALLPAASVAVAVTLKLPCTNAAGTLTLNVPPLCTTAVNVCTAPLAPVTASVTVAPTGRLVVPVSGGVGSLVSAGASTVTVGGVMSTTPLSVAVAVLPAASVPLAMTVKPPSTSAAGTLTLNTPPACTVVVKVCTAPLAPVTVSVIVAPTGRSVVPVSGGVVSLVSAGASTVITGGTLSTTPLSVAVAVLPAASLPRALTLNGPLTRAAGTSTLNTPPACTVVVNSCETPLAPVTVSVIVEPAGRSVVPVRAGVVSVVSDGASTVITGGVASTTPLSLAVALVPPGPLTRATAVYGPSASCAGTSTLYVPSPRTVVVKVCTAPSASVTVSVTVEPGGRLLLPVSVGVRSLVSAGASTLTVGVADTLTVSVALAVPPLPSLTL